MNDISEIRMHNTPDTHGNVSIEPIGTETRIIYHVDWEAIEAPTPRMFERVADAQVRLAGFDTYQRDVPEEVESAFDDAMAAVNDLMMTMAKSRAEGDDEMAQSLYMGNIGELPEVEKETYDVPAGSEPKPEGSE